MSPQTLRKLKREITRLRAGTPNISQLQRLARRLGRKLSNRGKEPTWVNVRLSGLRPISIPDHSAGIPRPTLQSIVDDLEVDLFMWEQILEQRKKNAGGGNGNGEGNRNGTPKNALRQGADSE